MIKAFLQGRRSNGHMAKMYWIKGSSKQPDSFHDVNAKRKIPSSQAGRENTCHCRRQHR